MTTKQIAVLGSGTMGHGIAQVSAMAGMQVIMRDVEAELVEKGVGQIEENLTKGVKREKFTEEEMEATLGRIGETTSLEQAVRGTDLVIEATPEKMEIKKDVFAAVEAEAPSDAVIATNTSTLSVTAIASELKSPERALGLHFFNPAHIIPLVEIVDGEHTDSSTLEFAEKFVDQIGKTGIVVQDTPGFTSSRLGAILSLEAVRMVQEGVAAPRDIDSAMELGYNHPMGPLELLDHTGLDVNLNAMQYLRDELGERYRPPQLLKRKVRAGKLGRKTGEGFYIWEDSEIVCESHGNAVKK